MYESPATLACVACGVIHAYAAKPPTRWVRTDIYEHLGVCRHCEAAAGDWDAGRFDPHKLRCALLALGRDAGPRDVEKTARRLADRIAWFALDITPRSEWGPRQR